MYRVEQFSSSYRFGKILKEDVDIIIKRDKFTCLPNACLFFIWRLNLLEILNWNITLVIYV